MLILTFVGKTSGRRQIRGEVKRRFNRTPAWGEPFCKFWLENLKKQISLKTNFHHPKNALYIYINPIFQVMFYLKFSNLKGKSEEFYSWFI
jgi:hypothetical protein